jgi:predicted GIY-YIG superfamily endonuclease
VYILSSLKNSEILYVGFTQNVQERLFEHNAEKSIFSSKYVPWKLLSTISFQDKYKALEFEKYLKSHSGKAFLHKRLI